MCVRSSSALFLDDLGDAIVRRKRLEAKKRELCRRAGVVEAKDKSRFWRNERKMRSEKLRLAKRIFSWGWDLCKTQDYSDLASFGASFSGSLPGTLWFSGGGWGHTRSSDNEVGCWSRLHLTKEGKFIYLAGYKWMGLLVESFKLETPEEMVEKLSFQYLCKQHDYIKSGRVYEDIKKRLDEER